MPPISLRHCRRHIGARKKKQPAAQSGSQASQAETLAWLETDRTPRILVSVNLSIVWTNSAAQIELGRRQDIEDRAGVLTFTHAALGTSLSSAIQSQISPSAIWSHRRLDGDGQLLFRIDKVGGVPPLFGLSFLGHSAHYRPQYQGLDRVFLLTDAEHRVLLALLAGLDAEGVAQLHEVSLETVRTQIRKLYKKMQVQSREALLYKAQPFRL